MTITQEMKAPNTKNLNFNCIKPLQMTKRKITQYERTGYRRSPEICFEREIRKLKPRRILKNIGAGFCYGEYRTEEYTVNRKA